MYEYFSEDLYITNGRFYIIINQNQTDLQQQSNEDQIRQKNVRDWDMNKSSVFDSFFHCLIYNYQVMQADLQLNRKNVPHFNSSKPQPIASLFQLLKLKKAELSKELQYLNPKDITLPWISQQKPNSSHRKPPKEPEHSELDLECSSNQIQSFMQKSPQNKYKTILDQMQLQKSRVSHRQGTESKLREQNRIHNHQPNLFSIKTYSRTKTETKTKQPRKTMPNSSSMQKGKEIQMKAVFYEDSFKRFCSFIEQVPKNMKMRNQQNLSDTISQLQIFNPFFNRNNRIINVCLLKMGKILVKTSPTELYRGGQQIDYFYIILLGKVKLVEQSFKRVCQTGETILQEILFSDKPKKVSFQRAKVLGTTYLLQMKIEQFKKLKQQLTRYGLKLNYQEMESIIKRNFIIKNWMRNKKRLDTYK